MKKEKFNELQKKIIDVAYKCNNNELYNYMIAMYIIEVKNRDISGNQMKYIPINV